MLVLLSITLCFLLPALTFIFALLYPESESCYASKYQDLATEEPTYK